MIHAAIIPPAHWWGRPRLRLSKSMHICGHEVPAGFSTDGATVPRLFWALAHPFGKGLQAAVLHDWLLASSVPRAIADREYHLALLACDVKPGAARILWAAVRLWSLTAGLRR